MLHSKDTAHLLAAKRCGIAGCRNACKVASDFLAHMNMQMRAKTLHIDNDSAVQSNASRCWPSDDTMLLPCWKEVSAHHITHIDHNNCMMHA